MVRMGLVSLQVLILALRHEELYSGIKDVVLRTDKIFEACEDVAILFRGITLV